MTNFTIMIKADAICLRHLVFAFLFLPTLSVAQWSLNIGFSAEINPLHQLNAIIDRNNHMNVPTAIAAIPSKNYLNSISHQNVGQIGGAK